MFKKIKKHKQLKKLIKTSHLFDKKYYLKMNRDARLSELSPLKHYIRYGLQENRKPNEIFEPLWYIEYYQDVKDNHINPFLHYIKYGMKEDRKPSEDFDPIWYKTYYADVDDKGIYPLVHYLKYGQKENRLINNMMLSHKFENIFDTYSLEEEYKIIKDSNLFDQEYYLQNNPDVLDSGEDPIEHYLKFGANENRNPNQEFDTAFYKDFNVDIKSTNMNPFLHWILYGQYENRRIKNMISEKTEFYSLPLTYNQSIENNMNIAVIIHAFYIDILENIISAIDNIPNNPTLFISVSKEAEIKEIENFLRSKNYHKFYIKSIQNRGRDVAPFLIEFAHQLQEFDLCCKIHGKKSLYSGSDRSDWRAHLYHNLLGSKEIVYDIVSKFSSDKKLGLLFSDNYGMLPYWGYTWLTNKGAVSHLLNKLKLSSLSNILSKTYIDYPAGTMFWFRPNAIKQILDTDFKYEDFPEEPIANDGTIAHGLERLFGFVCRLNHYNFIELNYHRNLYTVNSCHKNFNQHEAKTLEKAKEIVSQNEFIIFDIFDTLVTRTIFFPDNIFKILEYKIDQKFDIKSNFFEVRKNSENDLRSKLKYGNDVSYTAIYNNLHNHSTYSQEIIDYVREKEFELELEVLRRKEDAIELYNSAKQMKKKVYLVSDMYLEKKQISKIFKTLDIQIDDKDLFVSSDTGFRKDNSSVWKYFIDNKLIVPNKTLMIGDNEVSDAKIPGDFGIQSFHLLNEKNSLFESSIGKELLTLQHNDKNLNLLGPVTNKLFNSAFDLQETVLNFNKKLDPYEFGLVALGPFFYLFIENIFRQYKDKKIFFIARDGYFIKKAFEHYLKVNNYSTKFQSEYLLISRRAIIGAIEKDLSDLRKIILDFGDYQGYLSGLLNARMGIQKDFLKKYNIQDVEIKSQNDLEDSFEILSSYLDEINQHLEKERINYKKYLESIDFYGHDEVVVIDLGYSGTIQNLLQKFTGQKIRGEYFVTTKKVTNIETEKNTLNGFFADKIDFTDMNNTVYKYSLILESFLTSDKGQLLSFNDNITPDYKVESHDITIQEKILNGIKKYIEEMQIFENSYFNLDENALKEISTFMFRYFIQHRLFDDELASLFYLEDDFTGNKNLNILDILTQRGI